MNVKESVGAWLRGVFFASLTRKNDLCLPTRTRVSRCVIGLCDQTGLSPIWSIARTPVNITWDRLSFCLFQSMKAPSSQALAERIDPL